MVISIIVEDVVVGGIGRHCRGVEGEGEGRSIGHGVYVVSGVEAVVGKGIGWNLSSYSNCYCSNYCYYYIFINRMYYFYCFYYCYYCYCFTEKNWHLASIHEKDHIQITVVKKIVIATYIVTRVKENTFNIIYYLFNTIY